MTVKLLRGRSRNSKLIVAGKRVHVFVWLPSWSVVNDSVGVTVRYRAHGGWTHWRIVLMQRNASALSRRRGQAGGRTNRVFTRRTLTLVELSRWRTQPGTSERVGLKAYARLKVSPGGREAP